MLRKLPWPLAAALIVAAALVMAAAPTGHTTAATTLDSEEQAFVGLINQYRQQNNAGPLTIDPNIEDASRWMSGDMGAKNYFSHTDSLGRDPWTRMADFGYPYNTWKGENIAAGYVTAQDVFNGWKASPGHNANMLNPNYIVMGLARVYTAGSTYGWYWTNDFGGYDPNPSPPPAPTPSPTPAPTLAPTPTPTTAPTPAPTPTPSPTRTPAPAPTPTPTPAPGSDSDGDGFSVSVEQHVGTNPTASCGDPDPAKPGNPSRNWPADLATSPGIYKIDLADVTSFLAPVRRLGTSPGDPGFDVRWDLVPGNSGMSKQVNLLDMSVLITLTPPMFGQRAYDGPSCQ